MFQVHQLQMKQQKELGGEDLKGLHPTQILGKIGMFISSTKQVRKKCNQAAIWGVTET